MLNGNCLRRRTPTELRNVTRWIFVFDAALTFSIAATTFFTPSSSTALGEFSPSFPHLLEGNAVVPVQMMTASTPSRATCNPAPKEGSRVSAATFSTSGGRSPAARSGLRTMARSLYPSCNRPAATSRPTPPVAPTSPTSLPLSSITTALLGLRLTLGGAEGPRREEGRRGEKACRELLLARRSRRRSQTLDGFIVVAMLFTRWALHSMSGAGVSKLHREF
mmetsp:Transcript_21372/g.70819  ORF Transcript_21372/g.70819 Transcript_21372/m.70819 type:complete len:221 (-) Transcript_21372:95-757(-)